MKILGHIGAIVSTALVPLLLSCGKGEDLPESQIRFYSLGVDSTSVSTKGGDPLVTDKLNEFTVYSSYVASGVFDQNTEIGNYFSSQKAEKLGNGYFDTVNKFFWPTSGSLSFFAYTPSYLDVAVPSGQKGSMRITYRPDSLNVTNQKDFCVAAPMLNNTKADSPVGIKFDHATTFITFSAKYMDSEGALSDYELKMDQIDISGIRACRDIVIRPQSTDYFTWEDSSTSHLTTYTLKRSVNQLSKERITTEMSDITLVDGRLYLLPQTIHGAKLRVTYSFVKTVSGTESTVSQFSDEISLTDMEWKAGSKVRYDITLYLSGMKYITVEAKEGTWIDDWTQYGPSTPDKKTIL